MIPDYFECCKIECMHNANRQCALLSEAIDGACPFYKTEVQNVLEIAALTGKPPEWDAYRAHSGTKPVTREQIYNWLSEFEELSPCKSKDAKRIVDMFLNDDFISKSEAIRMVADYLDGHRDGCAWAMSPLETARMIFGGEKDDEASADEEISEADVSE